MDTCHEQEDTCHEQEDTQSTLTHPAIGAISPIPAAQDRAVVVWFRQHLCGARVLEWFESTRVPRIAVLLTPVHH